MMYRSVITCIILLCIACGGVSSCSCNTSTVWDALAALHRSTNGATWLRSDMWLQPGSSVCDWHGVVACSGLQLGSNNLTGTLPAELSLLAATSFVALNFSDNGISGTIPPQLALLSQMSAFVVGLNRLHGTLPPELASWRQLTRFFVSENNISGTLPPAYSAWYGMTGASFHNNKLTGTLPPSYSHWTNINTLEFSENTISGTLPPEYAVWRNLEHLRTHTNRLTGTLPVPYSNWTVIRYLEFFDNNISGTLPPEYAALSALTWFRIDRNQLTGTLPPEYAVWRNLEHLRMNANKLIGTLPVPYSNWTAIRYLEFFDNNISGTLPPEYAALSALTWIRIDTNQLTGTLPPEYAAWTALTSFLMNRNQLTGTLPPEYAAWSAVTQLTLSRNRLSGTIPAAYGALRPQLLLLDNNMLSGTVPTLRVSNVLTLHNNPHLRGTLPSDMGLPLVVALCNTSVCGAYPPMWAGGLTRVVCADADATASVESLVTEFFFLPQYVLPHCPTPSQSGTSSQAPTHASTRSIVTTISSTVGGLGAALSGSAALHVSLRAAGIAGRVGKCSDGGNATVVDEFEVGESVIDNPMRLSIPGPLPLTSGTVIGNLLLLSAVTLLCAAACLLVAQLTHRAGAVIGLVLWPATSLLLVWGFVQVPTAAASVTVAIEAARAASTAGGVVCAVGCTLCGGAVALAVACWLRVRRCRGRKPSVAHRTMGVRTLGAVRGYLFGSRSVWDAQTLSLAESVAVVSRSRSRINPAAAVVRWVTHVLQAMSVLLLRGCHYPHTWVIVYDSVGALLSGALIGVASTPHVSCRVVQAAAWAIAGVACVQAAVAVAVRPRRTVADCAFDAAMCTWTVVGSFLAALGVEEGSEESAIAQGAVALLYGLPAVALRCHRAWSSANAKYNRETEKRCKPVRHRHLRSYERYSRDADVRVPLADNRAMSTMSQHEALRWLVAHACRSSDARKALLSSQLTERSIAGRFVGSR